MNLLIFESAALAGAYNQYFNALFAQYQSRYVAVELDPGCRGILLFAPSRI